MILGLPFRFNTFGIGLTLISCLVIGVLYAVFGSKRVSSAKPDEFYDTMDRMESVAQACECYRRLVGAWPASASMLLATIQVKDTNNFVDSWGHNIVFIAPTSTPAVMWLKSYGADGLPNGRGTNADIYY